MRRERHRGQYHCWVADGSIGGRNDSGQWPAVRGQRSGTVVSGQWSVVRVGGHGQLSMMQAFEASPFPTTKGPEPWPLITNSSSNPEIPTDGSDHWRLITDHWPLVPGPCLSV
jgi:hypothetical protein